MGDRITIREIAEKAEVSPGTVDRVLHNRGEVSAKTRERVLKIAREGNYEPNIFARHLVLNKTFTIASILPKHKKNDYWAYPEEGIHRSASELKAFGIRNTTFLFEEEDGKDFEEKAEQALYTQPDGLLLAPTIYEKSVWLAEECSRRNIPLVLIDSDLPGIPRLTSISQDAFQGGVLAAKLIHFSGDHQRIFFVNISRKLENNDVIKQRKKGFLAYYKSQPLAVKVEEKTFKADESSFSKDLKNFIQALREKDAIFVPNSKVHFVAAGLEKAGKSAAVRLIGYDLTEKNRPYLEKNTIDFLINQKPERQGFMGLEAFYKHLVLKQEMEQRVFMPLEIVTRENMRFIS